VDLTALVTEAGQVWDLRARGAGVELRVEAPGRPAPVRADPRRLRQVLDGLAENALRITPAGSVLVLAALDEGALQVRDSGPGLSDEDYAVVFERGALHDRYRGRRPTGAGGVGLALAHGLVTRMGGTIAAGPAAEGGVAFTATLRTGARVIVAGGCDRREWSQNRTGAAGEPHTPITPGQSRPRWH
jgi:two-component system OmpR family sensor kinase